MSASILRPEVWAVKNILTPLERLYDGRPGGNDKNNKHNCTDHHVFNPPRKCIGDCAATVVNRYSISGSNVIILGRCDIFAAQGIKTPCSTRTRLTFGLHRLAAVRGRGFIFRLSDVSAVCRPAPSPESTGAGTSTTKAAPPIAYGPRGGPMPPQRSHELSRMKNELSA